MHTSKWAASWLRTECTSTDTLRSQYAQLVVTSDVLQSSEVDESELLVLRGTVLRPERSMPHLNSNGL